MVYLGGEELGEKAKDLFTIVDSMGFSMLDAWSQFVLIGITFVSIVFHLGSCIYTRKRLQGLSTHLERLSHYFSAKMIGKA